jgi:hypothetical protein
MDNISEPDYAASDSDSKKEQSLGDCRSCQTGVSIFESLEHLIMALTKNGQTYFELKANVPTGILLDRLHRWFILPSWLVDRPSQYSSCGS